MTTLVGKIQAHAASTVVSFVSAADAKSMAGFKSGLDKFASELCGAEASSNAKFGKLYTNMADQRADLNDDYGEAAWDINDKITKHAALQDSCLFTTVVSPSTLKTGAVRPRATA